MEMLLFLTHQKNKIMFEHIDRLRGKPEHIKRRIAFVTSLLFTVFIFAIWIGSFKIKSMPTALNKDINIKSPVSSITASIGDSLVYIKEMFIGSNKATYEATVEAIPGKR